MYLLIDNYDSFTYNLYHFLGELGAEIQVWRNDAISVEQAMESRPQGIVISPGPCDPDQAGISLDLVRAAAGTLPVLGVCLGHQAIGQAMGGRVIRAPEPMHGKLSDVKHTGTGVFSGIPSPSNQRGIIRSRSNAIACPIVLRLPPRPTTASSWASPIAKCHCTACSSIRKASPRNMDTSSWKTSWIFAEKRRTEGPA